MALPLFKIRKGATSGNLIDDGIKETDMNEVEALDRLHIRNSALTEDCEGLMETRVYILN